MTERVAAPHGEEKVNKKVVISGMLGNGLEWYDYALYGHMAIVFSKLFFPEGNASENLILTFLIFGAGFVSRPLGAVLFGYIGDKYGRKKALVTAMIMMAIPTGCIGLLPTYEMIGIAAPILLLMIRITQGLSLGGAFSGAMSYVVEHAPSNRRAGIGSVTMLSLVVGFLFGSLVSAFVSNVMPEEDFMSWGWRLPFFIGVCIGFVGFYIRNHGEESPVYEEAKAAGLLAEKPVRETFLKYPVTTLQAFAAYMFVTVPFYVISIYMIAYSKAHLGMTQSDALSINAIAMVGMFLPIWHAGQLADKIGRKKVLMTAIIAMTISVYPLFMLMSSGEYINVAIAQFTMGFILGIYLAPIPALLVEIFPTRIRYTGMSLSYNFCAIIGGFTPAIAETLIEETGDKNSIMYLLIVAGVISTVTLLPYKDRWKEKLT